MSDQELLEDLRLTIHYYYPQYKKQVKPLKNHQDVFVSDDFLSNARSSSGGRFPPTDFAAIVVLMPIGLLLCIFGTLFSTLQSFYKSSCQ